MSPTYNDRVSHYILLTTFQVDISLKFCMVFSTNFKYVEKCLGGTQQSYSE